MKVINVFIIVSAINHLNHNLFICTQYILSVDRFFHYHQSYIIDSQNLYTNRSNIMLHVVSLYSNYLKVSCKTKAQVLLKLKTLEQLEVELIHKSLLWEHH